jgi:hypothetical protein
MENSISDLAWHYTELKLFATLWGNKKMFQIICHKVNLGQML